MADTWKWTSQSKLCFVTTGATAPFTALIESMLSVSSLDTLCAEGYTHLLVQYGTAKDVFDKCLNSAQSHLEQSGKKEDLIIEGIDFDSGGLQAQFLLVQQSKGLVVSHAGTVTLILFCWETSLIMIRIWHHSGSTKVSDTAGCGTKYGSPRQSPGRACSGHGTLQLPGARRCPVSSLYNSQYRADG
jgi:UDP-N-acetylglucosamine transferase subunit ALG13